MHQIKSDNDQLTRPTTDEEAAQALWKFVSRVFLNERDGHDTQSEELVQEEEDWNIIINEDTVMSKLMGLKEDKSPGPDPFCIAEKLCKYCSPSSNNHIISEIIFRRYPPGYWNDCCCFPVIPDDWKTATVIPIFKKSNKHDANSLSSPSEISIAFCYFTQHTPAKSTAHLTKSTAHFVSENTQF